MAINFPSSPALNDTYTYGNRVWKWNGSSWITVAYTTAITTSNYVATVNGITGDASITAGSNVTVTQVGKTITIASTSSATPPPIATASLTGVASFGNEFVVSAAGAVSLTGNVVRSFNGATGAVVYAPPLATASLTGVASFNSKQFSVSLTGNVSITGSYQPSISRHFLFSGF